MLKETMPIVIDLPKGEVNKTFSIFPLSDIHIGSKQFSEKKWQRYKELVGDNYMIILGDCIDNGIKSAPGASMYEQAMSVGAQKEWLYEELKDFAENGQILAGTSGNHESRSKRETDTDVLYDVFCRWRIEDRYRSSMAFCFLRVGGADQKSCGKYRPTYCVHIWHGSGGGQTIGAGLNKVERLSNTFEGVDLEITGHTHRPAYFPSGRLVCDFRNKKIIPRTVHSVTVPSFLDYGGYAAEKGLPPTGFAIPEIILSTYEKGIDVHWHR